VFKESNSSLNLQRCPDSVLLSENEPGWGAWGRLEEHRDQRGRTESLDRGGRGLCQERKVSVSLREETILPWWALIFWWVRLLLSVWGAGLEHVQDAGRQTWENSHASMCYLDIFLNLYEFLKI
jgi:hypothetical protein